MPSLDRFSHPLSQEYASRECAYCGDYPCTCYNIDKEAELDRIADTWDYFLTREGY